ncbi:hypothetical protein ACIBLB_25815 [Streptosporangium canum]|uniref:hypothetical protein n=1 Tax=Streptosporangium canum TaxID=324952 RepID=UPI0037A6FD83
MNVPIDLDLLDGPGLGTPPLTPAITARIRDRIAHPQRAAALAAALFTSTDASSLARVSIEHLSPNATYLSIPTAYAFYAVPPHARGLMRAAREFLRLHRSESGRKPPRYLFRPAIGKDGQHLPEIAMTCDIALPPPSRGHFRQPWHRHAVCWWVADPVHGPEPDMHDDHMITRTLGRPP